MQFIYKWSFWLLATVPLLPLHIFNYVALFFILTAISVLFLGGIKGQKKDFAWVLLLMVPLGLGLISWMVMGTFEKTANFMGMYGSIALWPVLFYATSGFRKGEWDEVFIRIFILSTTAAVIVFNGALIFRYFESAQQYAALATQHDFSFIYRTTFSKITGFHPTYFSIWIWMSLAFISFFYRDRLKYYLFPVLILLIGALLLNSRMPFIAFFVSIMPLLLPRIQKSGRWLMFGALAIAGLYFGISRFGELSAMFDMQNINSVNIRWQVWDCALQTFQDNIWTGVGTGNGNQHLYSCYEQSGYEMASAQFLNSHNMYLNFFIENGIFGGLIFTGSLVAMAILFLRRVKSIPGFWMVLFFALCMITENLFHRQPAVVTFGLFVALFAYTKHDFKV